jgi:hypothetical protein
MSKNAWVALFAGLLTVTSPELIYHARWIAPDCLLTAAVSFSLLAQYRILHAEDRKQFIKWTLGASILAGICVGIKYPGLIVILPLFIAICLSGKHGSSRLYKCGVILLSLLAVTVVFFITTPGVLLQPSLFQSDVLFEMHHYSAGHGGNTVHPGFDHLLRLIEYLTSVLPTNCHWLSICVFLLSITGTISLIRDDRRTAIWFLSLPIAFVCFMSSQRVLIVRNDLLLWPILASLAGLGIASVYRATKERMPFRLMSIGFASGLLLYNLTLLTIASYSISQPSTQPSRAAIAQRIAGSPETRFLLSSEISKALHKYGLDGSPNIVNTTSAADRYIFYSSEIVDHDQFVANVPDRYFTVWSLMDEVNWDYYPAWAGNGRVLEVSVHDAALAPLIEGSRKSRSIR